MPAISLKSDESFLQKLAVGATGTKVTIKRLEGLGFQPIELERGSTGYKLWKKIKIKRVRVPDILCLRTGQRFESRRKTNLEISMSHSLKDPYRAWNAGMRDDDHVSVLLCERAGDSPVEWNVTSPVHFIKVADMKKVVDAGHVKVTTPKGVQEGSEIRMIWPSSTANQDSAVGEITEESLKLQSQSGRTVQKIKLARKGYSLLPQCKTGEHVRANQIAASVVAVNLAPSPGPNVGEDYFLNLLRSAALSERYAAAKALRFRGYRTAAQKLRERMGDEAEDIYVQLEAAAALAAHKDEGGWEFLSKSLRSEYLTVQLETVIVLSEIPSSRSEELLIQVLINPNYDSEVRSGAAWALGEFATRESAAALIDTFNLTSTDIKIEAARALLKITPGQIANVVESFKTVDAGKRDGIAWALARVGGFDPSQLLIGQNDDNLRRWLSYVVGYGKPHFIESQVERLANIDHEVHFAATVLWQILASWINGLEEF